MEHLSDTEHSQSLTVAAALVFFILIPANAQQHIGPLDCLVEPHVVIEISSPVPGVIGSIDVEKSDVVKRGQPLARLESAVWQSAVAEARSRAEATAAIESAEVNLAFAERNRERIAELFAKGVVASHHMDEARTDVDLAELELKRARENRRTASHELERARAQLRQRTIRSPIEGLVVARLKSPGEFVEVSPILELAQLNPLKIQVIAPASMFGSIRKGMRAEVMVESFDQPYVAAVAQVDRIVDGASGSFGVQLELPNPKYDVPVGLRCQVRLMKATRIAEKEPSAPTAAVAAQTASDTPSSCLWVGPFTTPELIARMETALNALSVTFTTHKNATRAPNGYLVLTRRQPSSDAAADLVEQIRRAGMDDVLALEKSPHQGRVSVGYFAHEEVARERRDEVLAHGIEVFVVPRYQSAAPVWFGLGDAARVLEDETVARVMRAAGPDSGVSRTSCDTDQAEFARRELHAGWDTGHGT